MDTGTPKLSCDNFGKLHLPLLDYMSELYNFHYSTKYSITVGVVQISFTSTVYHK